MPGINSGLGLPGSRPQLVPSARTSRPGSPAALDPRSRLGPAPLPLPASSAAVRRDRRLRYFTSSSQPASHRLRVHAAKPASNIGPKPRVDRLARQTPLDDDPQPGPHAPPPGPPLPESARNRSSSAPCKSRPTARVSVSANNASRSIVRRQRTMRVGRLSRPYREARVPERNPAFIEEPSPPQASRPRPRASP